jgi:NADPH-dependent 2,4-dienoyl-CoA reductase/sulfur reductase-like enzyme
MHLLIIGGSDGGISAGLRARELDPSVDVTMVVADAYPNFSICGLPYFISGDVPDWRNLAHRTREDIEATGIRLRLDTRAAAIDSGSKTVTVVGAGGTADELSYDRLVVATGAVPVRPPIEGLDLPRVHVLHTMDDSFAVQAALSTGSPRSAVIIGAGYIGLEMAEAFILRGLDVTVIEQLPEVLPTVDPDLGRLVHDELEAHGVRVLTGSKV